MDSKKPKFISFFYRIPEEDYFSKQYLVYLLGFICLLSGSISASRPEFYPKVIGLLFILSFGIGIFLLPMARLFKQKRKLIQEGEIILDENGVYLGANFIAFNQITSVDISYHDYRGKLVNRSDLSVEGMYTDGCENFINIWIEARQSYSYQYLIMSQEHRSKLLTFLEAANKHDLIDDLALNAFKRDYY